MCWDGSDLSARVVPAAARWAADLDLGVRLLTITPPGDASPLYGSDGEPTAQVDQLVAVLGGGTRKVQLTELFAADPARAIATFIDERPIGLVALCTRGRGGLASSSLGTIAAKVVQLSPRPVLVQPA